MSANNNPGQRMQGMPVTEQRAKEIVMDTLIELGLISQPQKRKQIANV